MNIVMMTNTYLPHVGGVAHSVERCTLELRRRGHRVLVVCPQFAGAPAVERDVFRIPAIQRFSGTDFSVVLPFTGPLSDILDDFKPDIVHSHHPFLLGHAALRVAARFERPIVFTHHTMYEYYTHYIPADSPQLQEFAAELAVGYGNLCNAVIAPSESLKEILLKRNIRVPVEVIPTGVDLRMFAGSGKGNLRAGLRIPANAFVIGHVGRLAPEKNLQFLCESVLAFMKKERSCHFIVAGDGPSIPGLVGLLKKGGVKNRIHFAGVHTGADLVRFYRTMNAFVFASKSETQGMVLVEAMAASVPVIGLDATGTRDVIEDGVNGFLVRTESRKEFAGAIEKLVRMPEAERKAMIQACARTAFRFSSEASCDRLASLYETLSSTRPRHQDPDKSVWWRTLKRIEAEWEIWNNVAVSLKQGMIRPARWPGRVHARVEKWWGWIRRKLSRIRWARALLQLPEFKSTKADRGLILVQIDGLSRRQFERAMAVRRMPFLKSLITTQGYEAGSFYSGIPSSTPAVQGELFYGVKCCVPAFEFYDRSSGTIRKMSTAEASREIEEKLKQEGEGLLKGGASYSNIFGGGADGVNYCATSIGWSSTFAMVRPARLLLLAIVYFRSTLRVAGLSVIEMLLSLVDSIEGIRQGEHPWKEIKFVPARVSISIALREIITLGACIDIARGVPVILLNFLGYDEQAHRRGPSALFAHWALKGIDGCVRRIFEAGVRSERRHYDLWIYSDHGQEETIPWCRHSDGKAIGSVISQVFQMSTFVDISSPEGIQTTRRSYLEGKRRRVCGKAVKPSQNSIVVAALGPLAHVYLPSRLPAGLIENACEELASGHNVPLVLMRGGFGEVHAWNKEGRYSLPRDAENVFGAGHPFLHEAAADVVELCQHPHAGDLVLSGWKREGPSVSFPFERGSHGGPGPEETRGFTLLPLSAGIRQDYLRPSTLREHVLRIMSRTEQTEKPLHLFSRAPDVLRVMTYNIHSCIGTDGSISIQRVASIVLRFRPDVLALQEVDVDKQRSGRSNQMEELRKLLRFEEAFFLPTMADSDGQYGDALLSRFPLNIIRASLLPNYRQREPRGAIWAEVDLDGRTVQVISTHLSLNRRERELQADELLGSRWLKDAAARGPLVFLGDLNAMPGSRVYRRIVASRLRDCQKIGRRRRPRPTWPSFASFCRIDHVYASPFLDLVGVEIPQDPIAQRASDHLPIVVDLQLRETNPRDLLSSSG